uniref:Uncharacterized protein n=1 Tax=Arundo donax TaxID=35708 RepID=A0A0A9BQ87_ARUDO
MAVRWLGSPRRRDGQPSLPVFKVIDIGTPSTADPFCYTSLWVPV